MRPSIAAIVSYNRVRFVERAVRCLVEQTCGNVELFVLDLGTDATAKVVARRFGARVTVLPSSGISSGRNEAIRRTKAELIAFSSSDTFSAPDRIERQAAELQRAGAGLCYTDVSFCDEQWQPAPRPRRGPDPSDRPSGKVFRRLLVGGNMVLGATVLVSRDALVAAGEFDERPEISQDYDLWVRIARTRDFIYLPDPLTEYRAATFAMPEDGSVAALRRHLRTFDEHRLAAIAAGVAAGDLDSRRAEILADLGYQMLEAGDASGARAVLACALRERPTGLRLARTLVLSALPRPLRRALRIARTRLTSRT